MHMVEEDTQMLFSVSIRYHNGYVVKGGTVCWLPLSSLLDVGLESFQSRPAWFVEEDRDDASGHVTTNCNREQRVIGGGGQHEK